MKNNKPQFSSNKGDNNNFNQVNHDNNQADSCERFSFDPQAVAQVKKSMLDEEEVSDMAETFKVLADPTRIKILYALRCKELCVCDLAVTLEMKTSAVSHQLRLLKGARLVKSRREGKNICYMLDDEHVEALFAKTREHIQHA